MEAPRYSSIRPEERYCRITETIHVALEIAYDALEEKILLRSLQGPACPPDSREPTREEAYELAMYEQVFKTTYYEKDAARSELQSPLHRGLKTAIDNLLGTLPPYSDRLNDGAL